MLIKREANVNDKDTEGNTPLIMAAYNGHSEVVDMLIKRGANVNDKDNEDKTALMWAAYNGHSEVVDILSEKKGHPLHELRMIIIPFLPALLF